MMITNKSEVINKLFFKEKTLSLTSQAIMKMIDL